MILHGMLPGADGAQVGGTKTQLICLFECFLRLYCLFACKGTVLLTLCVMVLDEKPKCFFKNYMEDDGCRKM